MTAPRAAHQTAVQLVRRGRAVRAQQVVHLGSRVRRGQAGQPVAALVRARTGAAEAARANRANRARLGAGVLEAVAVQVAHLVGMIVMNRDSCVLMDKLVCLSRLIIRCVRYQHPNLTLIVLWETKCVVHMLIVRWANCV